MPCQGDEREPAVERRDGPGLQVADGQILGGPVLGVSLDDALGGLIEVELDVVPARRHFDADAAPELAVGDTRIVVNVLRTSEASRDVCA